ncbi:MAG: EAL domain-containing protein [Spirochaetota bacterium]
MRGCKSIWFKTGIICSLLLAVGFLQASLALSLFGAAFMLACLIGLYVCDDSQEQFELRKPFSNWGRLREKQVYHYYCMFVESTSKGLYHNVLDHRAVDDMYMAAAKELEALFGKNHVWRLSRTQFVILKKFPAVHTMDEDERDIHQRWITNSVSQVLSNLIAVYDKEAMQMTELTIGTAASGLRYQPKSIEELVELAHFTQKYAQQDRLRYKVADETVRARKLDIEECKTGFRSAEYEEEFNPFFQPIIDPDSFRVVGFESLARWQLGGYRVLDAKVFKDLAFEMNRLEEIDAIIMQKTFEAAGQLHQDNLVQPNFRIVLNVSASTVMNTSASQLALTAEDHDLSPKNIEFDIRDQLLSDPKLSQKIEDLRSRGFRVALDAFDQQAFDLKAFFNNRFDTLKLDYSHYSSPENTAEEDYGHRVYDSLISMAQNLSVDILAKGIETREQLGEARGEQADYLQGSYFTPAVPLSDFRLFIKKYREGLYLEEYSGSSELA